MEASSRRREGSTRHVFGSKGGEEAHERNRQCPLRSRMPFPSLPSLNQVCRYAIDLKRRFLSSPSVRPSSLAALEETGEGGAPASSPGADRKEVEERKPLVDIALINQAARELQVDREGGREGGRQWGVTDRGIEIRREDGRKHVARRGWEGVIGS